MKELKFSLFEPLNGKSGALQTVPTGNLNLKELISYYNSDENKMLSQAIHKTKDPNEKKLLKNKRAYFTPYGLFSYRNNKSLTAYNRIVSIDIDGLKSKEEAIEVRNKLSKHSSTLFALLSVRQKGVKAIMLVNTSFKPKDQYQQLKHIFSPYLASYLNIDSEHIDNAQFKLSQPCYFSYDTEMYVNEAAAPLELEFNYTEPVKALKVVKTKQPKGAYFATEVPINVKTPIEAHIKTLLDSKLRLLTPDGARHQKLANAIDLGNILHYAPHLEPKIEAAFIEQGRTMYDTGDIGFKQVEISVPKAIEKGKQAPIIDPYIESLIAAENKKNGIIPTHFPLGLDYQEKHNDDYRYYPIFYKGLKIETYSDSSDKKGGDQYAGANFHIYDNDFEVISAQRNFNAPDMSGDHWQKMTETEFLKRLKEAYQTAVLLNPGKDILPAFKLALNRLNWGSNRSFSTDYVIYKLVPEWNAEKKQRSEFVVYRNWRVRTLIDVDSTYEFQRLLSADKRSRRTNKYIDLITPLVEQGAFIDTKELGIKRKKYSPQIFDFIKRYNTNVVGVTTKAAFNHMVDIRNYLIESVQKVSTLYNTNYIGWTQNVHFKKQTRYEYIFETGETAPLPSNKEIMLATGVSRTTLAKVLAFEYSSETLERYQKELFAISIELDYENIEPEEKQGAYLHKQHQSDQYAIMNPVKPDLFTEVIEYYDRHFTIPDTIFEYNDQISQSIDFYNAEKLRIKLQEYFYKRWRDAKVIEPKGCNSITSHVKLVTESLEMKRQIELEYKTA